MEKKRRVMYKYSKIIALASCVIWTIFMFAAFKGFHFWYIGFVFFSWITLASLNYRHKTTLWFLKNRFKDFAIFYLVLFTIGIFGDLIIGQTIANLWGYPYYRSLFDWARLYLITYPFGGILVLELILFLSYIFKTKFTFLERKNTELPEKILDSLDHFVDLFYILIIVVIPVLFLFEVKLPFQSLVVYSFLAWTIAATIELVYHVRHGLHWIAILVTTVLLSILLHEIPNTAVFEWRYYSAPALNTLIFDVPLWTFLGWYLMTLLMMRLWTRFAWTKRD